MKKIIFVIVYSFMVLFTMAQNSNPINTDRPDQSDGTYIMSQKHFQIEEGVLFAENNFQNNVMLRYGITKSAECRVLLDICRTDVLNGLMPLGVSFKQRIIQPQKIVPAITLVGYVRVGQLASYDFRNSNNPIDFKLAFQNDLTEKVSLSYNLGTSTKMNNMFYTVNMGYAPSEKLACFLEYFATVEKKQLPSQNLDAGLLYLINEKFQFDVAVGSSVHSLQNENFLTTGLSFRF